MQRYPKKTKDKDTDDALEFVFNNAFGNPIIFSSVPTNAQMKANTWGKVSGVNTALYVKFADGGAITITGAELL